MDEGLRPRRDLACCEVENLGFAYSGGSQNARPVGPASDLGNREIKRGGERIVRLQHRSAAIRHQEVAALAARFGDPVWIGVRKQRAGRMLLISWFETGRRPCSSRPPRRKPAYGISPVRAPARTALQPPGDIRGASAKPALPQ